MHFFRHAVFRVYRYFAVRRHRLNYLFWECTLRCNMNCRHCGSDCTKMSGVKDMSIEDFAKVLDDIKEKGVENLTVCITGGEPLLRDDLEKAGLEVLKRGYRWGIVSNALDMTAERFSSLLNAGLSSISFSMDGLEEQHTWLRQNSSSFKKVHDAVKMAVAVQKSFPRRLVFDVITCVHAGNIAVLPKLRDFLIEKGVKRWRIFSIFNEGRGDRNRDQLSLTKEQVVEVMDFIAETRRNFKHLINLNYSCEGYLGKYELKVRDYFYFCRGGINIGSVMCDGSVGACLSVRGKDFIQGNIYQENFMDIWNGRFENLRNRRWAKKGKCRKCRQWKKCLGNSLHLHHNMTDQVSRCNRII